MKEKISLLNMSKNELKNQKAVVGGGCGCLYAGEQEDDDDDYYGGSSIEANNAANGGGGGICSPGFQH